MHVVATNIIVWFRTLIKESIEEIWEYEESATHHWKVGYSSEITGLCLMKLSCESLKSFPYFWNKKPQIVCFFSFCATFDF